MKKLKNILIFASIVGFIFFLTFIFDENKSTENTKFEQVEYFKNDTRERIFCVYTTITDSAAILKWASSELMHTSGARTAAFFYNNYSDIPKITGMPTSEHAYVRTMDSDYIAYFNRNPRGNVSLRIK